MAEYLALSVISILLWVIFSLIVTVIVQSFGREIFIKLPKSKKYEGRQTPIYEVGQFSSFSSEYWIKKWELKWDKQMSIIMLFIPGIFGFNRFKYTEVGNYFLCEVNEIENVTKPISEIWEEAHAKHLEEFEKDMKDVKAKNKKLVEMNKTFNQNYI